MNARAEQDQPEDFDVVIVGGSQAGLAMGYHLRRRGGSFVILDGAPRVGDAWRTRWDSLRLFTPTRYSALPGMRFPGRRRVAPTKDEMADYLEAYAARFELPVRNSVVVDGLTKVGATFVVSAGSQRFTARAVVVATGAFHHPSVPAFAAELDPRIVQLHSKDYRNPAQLRAGGVLVVGAGNSGCDIALDVAADRPTWLAGRHPGHIPFRIEGVIGRRMVHVVRFVGHHVLNRRNPLGRKVVPNLGTKGDPVIRIKPGDIAAAGIECVPRVVGTEAGLPRLDDGRVLNVANVVWCTGFRQSFSWIDVPAFATDGSPRHVRGVASGVPGLYFLGLPGQFAATSPIVTGVGRDARYLAGRISAAGNVHDESAEVWHERPARART